MSAVELKTLYLPRLVDPSGTVLFAPDRRPENAHKIATSQVVLIDPEKEVDTPFALKEERGVRSTVMPIPLAQKIDRIDEHTERINVIKKATREKPHLITQLERTHIERFAFEKRRIEAIQRIARLPIIDFNPELTQSHIYVQQMESEQSEMAIIYEKIQQFETEILEAFPIKIGRYTIANTRFGTEGENADATKIIEWHNSETNTVYVLGVVADGEYIPKDANSASSIVVEHLAQTKPENKKMLQQSLQHIDREIQQTYVTTDNETGHIYASTGNYEGSTVAGFLIEIALDSTHQVKGMKSMHFGIGDSSVFNWNGRKLQRKNTPHVYYHQEGKQMYRRILKKSLGDVHPVYGYVDFKNPYDDYATTYIGNWERVNSNQSFLAYSRGVNLTYVNLRDKKPSSAERKNVAKLRSICQNKTLSAQQTAELLCHLSNEIRNQHNLLRDDMSAIVVKAPAIGDRLPDEYLELLTY